MFESAAEDETTADRFAIAAPFTGPYGGVPAFDKVAVSDFKPAYEMAIAEAEAELEEIASNPEAPTFENTIEALERQGSAYSQVSTYFGIWSSGLSSPELRAVEADISQLEAAYLNAYYQNTRLFERIASIWNDEAAMAALTEEQQRLIWDYYTEFVRAGAALDDEDRARVAEINEEMSLLQATFRQNLLHDEQAYVTWLSAEELDGLPDSVIAAAAAAAEARDRPGQYAILNTRSSMDPFLTYSDIRKLREKVWRTYYSRGDNGGEYDNNSIITRLLELRQERSRLLGYDTYADYALEKRVAGSPEQAMGLLMKFWPAATATVEQEVADMQAIADAEGTGITIAPWDYRYYAEKVRQARYDLDSEEVKKYLQLENLIDGMFWMAGELFDFEFVPVDDVPVFHPDVRVWKVMKDGERQGLFYFDPFAREGKRSGAWKSAYRVQSNLGGEVTPIVSNNSNFVQTAPGDPVLISWSDAETLFHEFGHALHGLLSDVTYPRLAGTRVARDYVEFPSQVFENWLLTPEILNTYALHYETGEPMPEALIQRIRNAATFNEGFKTTEYLASALVDLKLHTLDDATGIDPDAFERDTLAELGMPEELPMRHRTPQFRHVFSSEGYASAYYSYLWADTFGADAWEAFATADGGAWDKQVAQAFVDHILSVGNTVDPVEGYRAFRGRDVDVQALMRQRGFASVAPED